MQVGGVEYFGVWNFMEKPIYLQGVAVVLCCRYESFIAALFFQVEVYVETFNTVRGKYVLLSGDFVGGGSLCLGRKVGCG